MVRTLHQYRRGIRIPYKPEFFSGFLFATAKVASVTAMIYYFIIPQPAVHIIYDFDIFITSSPSFHGFITNQFNDNQGHKGREQHRDKTITEKFIPLFLFKIG